MSTTPLTYASTGVEYDSMDPIKRLAQTAGLELDHFLERFGFKAVKWSRGESASLVETPFGYIGFVIEGLGTKVLVADALEELARKVETLTGKSFHANVAQCNGAMAFNDLITVGVLPAQYGQYLAAGHGDWFKNERRAREIILGTKRACELARCSWGGGETPTLKGIIEPSTCDLAGATWGLAPRDRIINPERLEGDEVIVLVESSGIHANGLTLARKIAERKDSFWRRLGHLLSPERFPLRALPDGYLTPISDGRTYGEALLDPTHIYVGLVEDCFRGGVDIRYAVNITGHGWRKLMRARKPFAYVIETLPTQLPIFDFIQKHGPVDDEEAYANFNMGAGFALYVPSEDVNHVLNTAEQLGLRALDAGYLEPSAEKKVVIQPKGITYAADTLAVR